MSHQKLAENKKYSQITKTTEQLLFPLGPFFIKRVLVQDALKQESKFVNLKLRYDLKFSKIFIFINKNYFHERVKYFAQILEPD